MKPGFKTTEFWMSLGAQIIGALMASGVIEATSTTWDDKIVGMVVMLFAALGYTINRMVVKKKV